MWFFLITVSHGEYDFASLLEGEKIKFGHRYNSVANAQWKKWAVYGG